MSKILEATKAGERTQINELARLLRSISDDRVSMDMEFGGDQSEKERRQDALMGEIRKTRDKIPAVIERIIENEDGGLSLLEGASEALAALKTARSVLGTLLQSDSGTYANATTQIDLAIAKSSNI